MKYIRNTATLKFHPEKCRKCMMCINVCPHSVFEMIDGNICVADRDGCMECGACARNCRFGALEVSAGVGCAQAVIYGMLTGKEASCDCSKNE